MRIVRCNKLPWIGRNIPPRHARRFGSRRAVSGSLIRQLRGRHRRCMYVSLCPPPLFFLHSNQKDLAGTSAQIAPCIQRHERENNRCRRRTARDQGSEFPLPNPNPSELETCRDICALRLDTPRSVPLRPGVACINLPRRPQELKRRFANDADRVDRRTACTIQECTHRGNCLSLSSSILLRSATVDATYLLGDIPGFGKSGIRGAALAVVAASAFEPVPVAPSSVTPTS